MGFLFYKNIMVYHDEFDTTVGLIVYFHAMSASIMISTMNNDIMGNKVCSLLLVTCINTITIAHFVVLYINSK